MGYFAVIDTETNWEDQVMSIGTVIADENTFQPVAAKYHILPQECAVGGMFYDALSLKTPVKPHSVHQRRSHGGFVRLAVPSRHHFPVCLQRLL